MLSYSANSPFWLLPGVPGVPPLKSSRERKVEPTLLAGRSAQVVPLWGGTPGTPGRTEISEADEGVSVPLRVGGPMAARVAAGGASLTSRFLEHEGEIDTVWLKVQHPGPWIARARTSKIRSSAIIATLNRM
jgi:hypothetical protein